jgi:deoxyribonuclease V
VLVAIIVLSYPDMVLLDTVTSEASLAFPYIPGLLAFRVGPAILATWEKLKQIPDLIMMHGHGTAHPRGVGLASHMGLWLEVPTIGIAKSKLFLNHAQPGSQMGDWSTLMDEMETSRAIGAVLRTRVNTKPVYVSAGHLIDLQNSVEYVLVCCRGFRLPEPIRVAHTIAATQTTA